MTVPLTIQDATGGNVFRVRLEGFEGPLDLLLHMIRTSEIDLTGIPVLEVARQYGEYLNLMRAQDLASAGENLLLAATLVHLKSRLLLPPDPDGCEAERSEEDAESAIRLVMGDGLRNAAEHLQEREALMELVFPRPDDRVSEYSGEQGLDVDLYALMRAFHAILKRSGSDPADSITRERFSLVERIDWLIEKLNRERRVSFSALFEDAGDRLLCILTFLALLEVLRLRVARAYQSHHRKEILILLHDQTPVGENSPEEPRSHV